MTYHPLKITRSEDFDDDKPELPHKWEICDGCRGEGKRLTKSIGEHAYSREDFDEDPDFAEAYFNGTYDVACWECGGSGKVKVPDVARMTFAQKRAYVLQLRSERQYHNDYDSERFLRYAENGGW